MIEKIRTRIWVYIPGTRCYMGQVSHPKWDRVHDGAKLIHSELNETKSRMGQVNHLKQDQSRDGGKLIHPEWVWGKLIHSGQNWVQMGRVNPCRAEWDQVRDGAS